MTYYRNFNTNFLLHREDFGHRRGCQNARIAGWWFAISLPFILVFVGCGKTQSNSDRGVEAELISMTPMSGDQVKLLMKVTNVSGKEIVRAKAMIVVLDSDGNSLGSKSTYLIRSAAGGLAAGGSVEEDAFIDVKDKDKATSMSFEIEDIRFKK